MNNNNLSYAIEAITDAALNTRHNLSVAEYKQHLTVLLANRELSCSIVNTSFGGMIEVERVPRFFGGYVNSVKFY